MSVKEKEISRRHGDTETASPSINKFAKDKRKRITKTEKAVPMPKDRSTDDRGASDKRKSYNPNFTTDNKLRGADSSAEKPFRKSGGSYPPKGKKNDYPPKRDTAGRPQRRDKKGMINGEYPKFPAPRHTDAVRLNKYIAAAGICSRREADENIKLGLVTVNGEVVTELGSKVLPEDIVKFNGHIVRGEKKVYILLNKPKGYVTTVEDPHADKTVMDLLRNCCSERVYPVGRLDRNSLGVLLVTNDGELTKKLTHPSHNKKKIYQVALDKPLTKADMQQILDGVTLEDGEIRADEINYVGDNKRDVGIEIHSGRNRVVRRIFESLGYKVTKLDRVYFAGLTKKNLKRGAWRFLTPREVEILRSGMYE